MTGGKGVKLTTKSAMFLLSPTASSAFPTHNPLRCYLFVFSGGGGFSLIFRLLRLPFLTQAPIRFLLYADRLYAVAGVSERSEIRLYILFLSPITLSLFFSSFGPRPLTDDTTSVSNIVHKSKKSFYIERVDVRPTVVCHAGTPNLGPDHLPLSRCRLRSLVFGEKNIASSLMTFSSRSSSLDRQRPPPTPLDPRTEGLTRVRARPGLSIGMPPLRSDAVFKFLDKRPTEKPNGRSVGVPATASRIRARGPKKRGERGVFT